MRAFLEDSEGYIWIATSTGGARWDRSLTTYDLGSSVWEALAVVIAAILYEPDVSHVP